MLPVLSWPRTSCAFRRRQAGTPATINRPQSWRTVKPNIQIRLVPWHFRYLIPTTVLTALKHTLLSVVTYQCGGFPYDRPGQRLEVSRDVYRTHSLGLGRVAPRTSQEKSTQWRPCLIGLIPSIPDLVAFAGGVSQCSSCAAKESHSMPNPHS